MGEKKLSRKIRGRVFHIFGANVNTDEIISGKYKYDELDMGKLAIHTFESVYPNFYNAVRSYENPILVASTNFGCGSSREQAPAVLKECGIVCIIAPSFGRIFFRNAINIGLPLIECEGIEEKVRKGDELEVDFKEAKIKNITKGEEYAFLRGPSFLIEIMEKGLVAYLKEKGGFEGGMEV
ncbi:MAG: LeuD/DmdB family oxidoreductase small subunit [Candidatus Methanospirareceae archaeon]